MMTSEGGKIAVSMWSVLGTTWYLLQIQQKIESTVCGSRQLFWWVLRVGMATGRTREVHPGQAPILMEKF